MVVTKPMFEISRDLGSCYRHVVDLDGNVLRQVTKDGAPRRAATNYRTTDPVDIAFKLERQGFRITAVRSLWSHGPFVARHEQSASPWRKCMEVAFPGAPVGGGDPYSLRARILLAHTGRDALRIAMGAMRIECANQFTSCILAVRHTDPEIDGFVADPAAWLYTARDHACMAVDHLEELRGFHTPLEYVGALRSYPKVGRAVQLAGYDGHYHPERTLWGLAQALTASRAPRAVRAAMGLVSKEGMEHIRRNEPAPGYFKAWEKPTLAKGKAITLA